MRPDEKATMYYMREAMMTPEEKAIREEAKNQERQRIAHEAAERAKAREEILALLDELMGPPVKKAPEPDIRIEM